MTFNRTFTLDHNDHRFGVRVRSAQPGVYNVMVEGYGGLDGNTRLTVRTTTKVMDSVIHAVREHLDALYAQAKSLVENGATYVVAQNMPGYAQDRVKGLPKGTEVVAYTMDHRLGVPFTVYRLARPEDITLAMQAIEKTSIADGSRNRGKRAVCTSTNSFEEAFAKTSPDTFVDSFAVEIAEQVAEETRRAEKAKTVKVKVALEDREGTVRQLLAEAQRLEYNFTSAMEDAGIRATIADLRALAAALEA